VPQSFEPAFAGGSLPGRSALPEGLPHSCPRDWFPLYRCWLKTPVRRSRAQQGQNALGGDHSTDRGPVSTPDRAARRSPVVYHRKRLPSSPGGVAFSFPIPPERSTDGFHQSRGPGVPPEFLRPPATPPARLLPSSHHPSPVFPGGGPPDAPDS